MVEMSCALVTPYVVLESSGHVAKFSDLLVLDSVTSEPYRADHLIEEWLDDLMAKTENLSEETKKEYEEIKIHADAMTPEETKAIIERFDMKSKLGNKLTDPVPFNMMFQTQIGPKGLDRAFD